MADAGDVRRMLAIGRRLESWGVAVRWMPGWESRGSTWARVPVGVIDHHDAHPTRSSEWGYLNAIVQRNLAQFQVARCLDGVPRVAICAAGRSAHAGVGGWRFPDGVTVPTNDGNSYLYGAEKANDGRGEKATEAADYAADALFRAVLEECGGLPAHRVVGHKEYGNTPPGGWAGRKTDPTYDMNWRRKRVAEFRPRTDAATPEPSNPGDDDMRVLIDNKGSIHLDSGYEIQTTGDLTLAGIWQKKYGQPVAVTEGELGIIRADNEARRVRRDGPLVQVAAADVDEDKLATALAPTLVPAVLGAMPAQAGMTPADVEEAVRKVLRSLQSSLD